MDQNGSCQAKMDHFGFANAKIRFGLDLLCKASWLGIRSLCPKWSYGPFWTVLVQSDRTAAAPLPIKCLILIWLLQ